MSESVPESKILILSVTKPVSKSDVIDLSLSVSLSAPVSADLYVQIIENSFCYEFYYRYKHFSTAMNHIYDQKVDEKSE